MNILQAYKVFVGSIPVGVSDFEVTSYFQMFAPDARFCFERKPHKNVSSGGYGFLLLSNRLQLETVLAVSHYVGGRLLKCGEYFSGDTLNDYRVNLAKRRILIRNVKKSICDKDVEEFFGKFGELDSAYIVKFQSSNRQRSFGYVTFKQEEPANRLLAMGKVMIKGVEIFILPFMKSNPVQPGTTKQSSKGTTRADLVSEKKTQKVSKTSTLVSPKMSAELDYALYAKAVAQGATSAPEFTKRNQTVAHQNITSLFSESAWDHPNRQVPTQHDMSLMEISASDQTRENRTQIQGWRFTNPLPSLLEVYQTPQAPTCSKPNFFDNKKPTSINYSRVSAVASNHSQANIKFRCATAQITTGGRLSPENMIQEGIHERNRDHDSLTLGLGDL